MDLQSEKYGLSFDIKKYTTSGWTLGDENVIGIRAFNTIPLTIWFTVSVFIYLFIYLFIIYFLVQKMQNNNFLVQKMQNNNQCKISIAGCA